MATIAGIRDQLATLAKNADADLHEYDVATGSERLPAVVVFPETWEDMTAANAVPAFRFVVEIYVGIARKLSIAQDEMDAYINPTGTRSIPAAIRADRTLGGTVDSTRVFGPTRYGLTELNGNTGVPNALMARLPVEVLP